jgi:cardiolipin synthase
VKLRWRIRPQRHWLGGNSVRLLTNGEEYFPAVFAAIAQASHEVLIETFILFEDKVGMQLQRALIDAAQRGVRVDLGVDGWGSRDLTQSYIAGLTAAGVHLRAFDLWPNWFGLRRLSFFRRMHRKIVVIDGQLAFVGGINFSADHLCDFGPEAKQDYTISIRGPLVERIRSFVIAQLDEQGRRNRMPLPAPGTAGDAHAMFVIRDNGLNRNSIEREYRAAIRAARREVIIANAYFFPGYRLLKAMRRAARRGVRVHLILQGQPDMAIVKHAAATLHAQLLHDGVTVYEYCKRSLHGKVPLVDDQWATVGSSNLDPLSLALNLEANVMVRDAGFSRELRAEMQRLMDNDCKRLESSKVAARRGAWQIFLDTLAYHLTRHFPSWMGWLPGHSGQLERVPVASASSTAAASAARAPEGPATASASDASVTSAAPASVAHAAGRRTNEPA